LDPFTEYQQPKEVKVKNENFCFAYEPFYIGKGTGAGYRHNQHISAFIKGNENNPFKIQKFKELAEKMAEAAAKHENSKPWNWSEYQKNWVIILKTFDNPKDLLEFEMEFIKKLGTKKTGGPLTNKIENAFRYSAHLMNTGKSSIL